MQLERGAEPHPRRGGLRDTIGSPQLWPMALFMSTGWIICLFHEPNILALRVNVKGPEWVDQLVRALSPYANVAGWIPSQDIHRSQPMSA